MTIKLNAIQRAQAESLKEYINGWKIWPQPLSPLFDWWWLNRFDGKRNLKTLINYLAEQKFIRLEPDKEKFSEINIFLA